MRCRGAKGTKMEQQPKTRGRPKGSKTAQDKRKPGPGTEVVFARVSSHVAQMLASEAERKGQAPGTLLAEVVSRRWACRCDECVAVRRKLRKWERQRVAAKIEIDPESVR